MSNFRFFKGTTSAFITLIIGTSAVAPLALSDVASAQLFPTQRRPDIQRRSPSYPSSRQLVIPSGTTIPVQYDEAEKILVTKEETAPVTLKVAANLKNRYGDILIPYGSEIVGQIEPAGEGSQFVAEKLVLTDGREQSLNATSEIVTRTEKVKRGANTGDILKGAAIGAAAASVVAAITGDTAIATEEVLGGAGLGALGGWILGGNSAELISIDPNNDLDVTLNSDLALLR